MAPMSADLVIKGPAHPDGYVESLLAQRGSIVAMALINISKAQCMQRESHDKCVKLNEKFVMGDLVAYCKATLPTKKQERQRGRN